MVFVLADLPLLQDHYIRAINFLWIYKEAISMLIMVVNGLSNLNLMQTTLQPM